MTRGLRVWLPPEVYMSRDLAIRESIRWREVFDIPPAVALAPNAKHVHLVRTQFADSWWACPIWAGVSLSERTYPRIKAELMAADETEAFLWLRRRMPKAAHPVEPGQAEFVRRGVRVGVGIHRIKRVMGF